jgi:protein gp37
MHPDWVRSVRNQCAEAGVPFFFKQWGKHLPSYDDIYGDWSAPPMHVLIGDKGRLLDGREHNFLAWVNEDAKQK